MTFKNILLPKFYIVGISVRTTNKDGQAITDIGQLFSKFMSENLTAQISNKESEDIYCMYTDYESDWQGLYTTIIGCKVSSVVDLPQGFTYKEVPECNYRLYEAQDNNPASVGAIWSQIWSENDSERKYLADFDVYSQNSNIKVYLSIKQ